MNGEQGDVGWVGVGDRVGGGDAAGGGGAVEGYAEMQIISVVSLYPF